jgi:uncharacterized cupredoxin-like copper-binding protein
MINLGIHRNLTCINADHRETEHCWFDGVSSPEENFMSKHNFLFASAIGLVSAFAVITPAAADAVVKVTLTDKGGTMDLSKSMGLGLGMHADMKAAIMGIGINPKAVPAGKVKFNVTNSSTATVHEMIVAPIADENVVMPFNANDNKVDEEASHDLGEVSELDPGKSGTLVVDMKPGKYLLYCNVSGHFMAGMWTVLVVK